eukprot:sb/3465694/
MKSYKCEKKEEHIKLEKTTVMEISKKIQSQDKGTLVRACTKRISALAIHPTTHTFLVAGGSKNGELGITALAEDQTEPVSVRMQGEDNILAGLKFSSDKLYSSSYTGICRVLDPTTSSYDTVIEMDDGIRGLDIRHDTDLYLTGQGTGQVNKVDTRTNSVSASYPAVEDYRSYGSLWSVNCHPFDENYFVSSSNNGTITLWDDRQTKEPLDVNDTAHSKSVSSAVFDLATGNTLVTVAYDDLICRLGFKDKSKLVTEETARHMNETGRWLTKFQAEWYPKSDTVFAIGSMARPRRFEFYNSKLAMIQTKTNDEILVSVQSLIRFHPSTGAIATGNSSGYVTLWRSSSSGGETAAVKQEIKEEQDVSSTGLVKQEDQQL